MVCNHCFRNNSVKQKPNSKLGFCSIARGWLSFCLAKSQLMNAISNLCHAERVYVRTAYELS